MKLNEENRNIINKYFKNLKENQTTIKFGTLDKRTPIFSIFLDETYYTTRLVVKRKSMKGCYSEDKSIFSCVIINAKNRFIYKDNSEEKDKLINRTINNYLRTHLDELKSLDFLDTYEREELTEEEKNERFDALLVTLSLEGNFETLYETIYNNLSQEGVFRAARIGARPTEQSIASVFRNLARRIDNNSSVPFIERFGFDFFDFHKQIKDRFFEDRVPNPLNKNHYLLLKDFNKLQD